MDETTGRRLKVGDWLVDPGSNEVTRGAECVRLEPKAVDVLVALARRANEVVTREQLLAQVWTGVVVGDDVLTQSVIKLRKALGDTSKEPRYIETIPKRGYRLIASVSWLDVPEPRPAAAPARFPYRWLALMAVPVIVAAAGLAYWRYAHDVYEGAGLAPNLESSEPVDVLPKVFVHAFREVEADSTQAVLARGLTAHLIAELGRISSIRVIAIDRDSGTPAEPKGGRTTGSYRVQGDVQRSGDKIRLHVRLSDAASGHWVWSERYDRPYGDLLALQDELVQNVLSNLRLNLSDAELRRRAKPYTQDLKAYEYFVQAQSALLVRRKAENEVARSLYLKAIELDPAFARAHAGLALTHAADRRNNWTADGVASLAKAFEVARRAQRLDPDIPETYFALAYVSMERGSQREAIEALRTALRLNPSYGDAYALLGAMHTYAGRPWDTLELIRTAMRLAPDAGHLYFLILGRAYYFIGDAESASLHLRQALSRNPESVETRLYLAASLARSGDLNAAAWEADQIRALEPAFRVRDWLKTYPLTDSRARDTLVRDLEKAHL